MAPSRSYSNHETDRAPSGRYSGLIGPVPKAISAGSFFTPKRMKRTRTSIEGAHASWHGDSKKNSSSSISNHNSDRDSHNSAFSSSSNSEGRSLVQHYSKGPLDSLRLSDHPVLEDDGGKALGESLYKKVGRPTLVSSKLTRIQCLQIEIGLETITKDIGVLQDLYYEFKVLLDARTGGKGLAPDEALNSDNDPGLDESLTF
ncbi:MAG: hypothetical protein Q9223_002984 [Gallowayella weberi]